MRLLITGAAGVLARTIVGLLERDSAYTLRLTDVAEMATPREFVTADLSCPQQVAGLCEGIDQVLHVAAIHPWKPYTPEQYLDCNIKGTHNLVAEAARAGVSRLIYTSSVAAMGYDVDEGAPLPFDETRPCRPYDSLYSVSKHAGEQFCRLYAQTAGLSWLALRPGTFVPREETDPAYGLSLLGIGVHRDDVAAAHLCALRSDLANEAFICTAGTEFSREEGDELLADAAAVIRRHYPEVADLGPPQPPLQLPQRLCPCYSIDKARRLLGYEPQHTFRSWLQDRLQQSGK